MDQISSHREFSSSNGRSSYQNDLKVTCNQENTHQYKQHDAEEEMNEQMVFILYSGSGAESTGEVFLMRIMNGNQSCSRNY